MGHRDVPAAVRIALRLVSVVLLVGGATGCATAGGTGPGSALAPATTGSDASLVRAVEAVVGAPPLDQVSFGVLAVDDATGEVLVARNAQRKFIPASNAKTVVTAAALAHLGPGHTFRTAVWRTGPLVDGRVEGDLVVPGTGDPTLSARFHEERGAAIEAIARRVAEAGVRSVDGALVIDASAWDSTTVAGTWMWSNIPARYSAAGGAFAVEEGEARIQVVGGARAGEPAAVTAANVEPGFVVPHVTTVAAGEDDDLEVGWLPESRRLELTGEVPVGDTVVLSVSVRDPVRQGAAVLERALEEAGVEVEDGWRIVWDAGLPLSAHPAACRAGAVPDCPRAALVAELVSPPLIEIVDDILEPSQNWITEQVVRALGVSDTTAGGWSTGLDVLHDVIEREMGVDSLDVSLRDGSGLSAYSLVTPRAMVRIFGWTQEQPWAEAYRDALAEPGEAGSTLSGRLEGLEDRLWAKTGTISNVNSLSGLLVTDAGRRVRFSVLSNGSGLPSSVVRDAIDEIVLAIAAQER